MAIPESQLETWSHQGSITQSSNTYNTIKNVLEGSTTPYANKNFKVFLQGSYGNDTNIYAESDVGTLSSGSTIASTVISNRLLRMKSRHTRMPSTMRPTRMSTSKQDVLSVLEGQYGSAVKPEIATFIDASGSRRKADVIVATQFRRYFKFRSTDDSEYVEGICFFNAAGERIANYPKQHSANLTSKHQGSSKWLKPAVRVLKNMRSRMVDEGLIKAGVAPSYYIEGLLYNVPPDKLSRSYENCIVNILNWYRQDASKTDLVCANEQYYLLRDGHHTCWSQSNCDAFVEAAVDLWNQW